MKMSNSSGGFGGLLEKWKDDPAFVAAGIAIDLSIAVNKQLERLEMTRKQLAERVHVSPGRVSQIMAGNINLTLLSICKVALAVGLKPSLNLSAGEAKTATTPASPPSYVGMAALTPATPGGLQVYAWYSTTAPIAFGSLATFTGRAETAGPSSRPASEGLVAAGQQRPGEAA
jgi:transcriptional regulator with XRE-family HTH domain